jgi:hypothetical protein
VLPEKLTVLVEQALADRAPLTLTLSEVCELAVAVGIADPHEIIEPVEWPSRGRAFVSESEAPTQLLHPVGRST